MPRVLIGYPARRYLVRIRCGPKCGNISFRNTAFEHEVELVLAFRTGRLFPIYFSDMQQFRHRDIRSDLFPAFPFQGRDEILARLLLSTWQGEVQAFHRVLFFLNQ